MPRPDVALGDRHDEPQVGLDEAALGVVAVVGERLQPCGLGGVEGGEPALGVELGELDRRLDAGLDALGERHLLGRDQQRHPTDLAQVHADGVGRASAPALGRVARVHAGSATHRGRQAADVGPFAGEQHDGGVVVVDDVGPTGARRATVRAGSDVEVLHLLEDDTCGLAAPVDLGQHLAGQLDAGQGTHEVVLAQATRLTSALDHLGQRGFGRTVPCVERRWHVGSTPVSLPGAVSQASNRSADSAAVWAFRRPSTMPVSSAEIGQRLRAVLVPGPRQPQIGDVAAGGLACAAA